MDVLSRVPPGNAPADREAPPGLDTEALYTRGMAHYRRREWAQAMDCFTQLKALDPNHPGIDALLDELEWFIQLQAIEPDAQPSAASTAEVNPPTIGPVLQPLATSAEQRKERRPRRFPWQGILWSILALALIGGVYWVATRPEVDPANELYNRAQARMARRDYAGAIQAFEELLARDPANEAAQVGIDKARRLENLGVIYAEAQQHIKAGEWDAASEDLKAILQLDSSYEDAAALAQRVESERTLASLLSEAQQYSASSDWAKAWEKLERIKATDGTYHQTEVRNLLFTAYLNDGRRLVNDAVQGVANVQSAIQRFTSALGIRPQDQDAGDQKRMATALLEAFTLFDSQSWQSCVLKVKPLYDVSSRYGGGAAARMLSQAYVGLGDQYRTARDYSQALVQYRLALAVKDTDTTVAADREQELLASAVTPTPTATATSPAPVLPTQGPVVEDTPEPTATLAPTQGPINPPPPTQPPPPPPPTKTSVPPSATPKPPTPEPPKATATRQPR